MTGTQPPPRPSRANTANLNDIFPTQNSLAHHRLSDPVGLPPSTPNYYDNSANGNYTDPQESQNLPPLPPMPLDLNPAIAPPQAVGGIRSRSGTQTTKSKKGMFNFVSDLLNTSKKIEISTPYDPVHLTHVGFNSSTGEFTGLPKEWQQLLQESGISKSDQEKNPQAVMEIVKFYQEGRGEGSVWDKMGGVAAPQTTPSMSAQIPRTIQEDGFQNPVSIKHEDHLDICDVNIQPISPSARCASATETTTYARLAIFVCSPFSRIAQGRPAPTRPGLCLSRPLYLTASPALQIT